MVDALHAPDRLPAVHRLQHRHLREPHDVGVLRVDRERRVVPGPLPQRAVAARERPRLAPVVRAEEPALLGLDERVDALRERRRHRDAHLAPDALGEPLARDLLPRVAAVARDVERGAGAAAHQLPGPAPRLPQPGEHDARVLRVERDVGGAGVRVRVEDLLPRLPAVARAIDAALGVGAEGLAEHGRVGDVGVCRVDDHRADLAVLLPHVLPRLPGVRGLVDAVSLPDVAADVGLARADVDDVRVGRRHRDRADRARRLVVEDRLPPDPAVRGLPYPARGGGRVVRERVAGHAGHARDAPAGRRADQPVLEAGELLRPLRGRLAPSAAVAAPAPRPGRGGRRERSVAESAWRAPRGVN